MTTTTRPREGLVEAPPSSDPEAGSPPTRERGRPRLAPGRALGVGVVGLWLSVIVLLPLAALTVHSLDEGVAGFWDAVTAPVAVAAIWTTLLVSAGVALVNAVMGTLIAWVLVRDDFPGKRSVDALIDLPFALPTIVASIVLLSLYGPNSPIGVHLNATRWGLAIALAFVTLPFVVRSVQPVLIDMERDVEEAAASLGASGFTTFRRIILPTIAPAILAGSALSFARALGEFGSVILISANLIGKTEVSSAYMLKLIESDDTVGAAGVATLLLIVAIVVLVILDSLQRVAARRD